MIRALLLAGAVLAPAPAIAQAMDHSMHMPGVVMPARPAAKPARKPAAKRKPTRPAPARRKPPATTTCPRCSRARRRTRMPVTPCRA